MNEFDKVKVKQFSDNVLHLSQQSDSRIAQYLTPEVVNSSMKRFDRYGKRDPRRKQGRNSDTDFSQTPKSNRWLFTEQWYDSELFDTLDDLETIHNVTNETALAMAAGMSRKRDEIAIEALLGTAMEGNDKPSSAVVLPNTQKLVAFSKDGSSDTIEALNVETMRAVKKKFGQAEVKGGLIWAYSAEGLDQLLGTTEVTSKDFNSVQTLVNGEVDSFMGFKFVELELLPFNDAIVYYNKLTGAVVTLAEHGGLAAAASTPIAIGNARRSIVFKEKTAAKLGQQESMFSRISEREDKHHSWQVYLRMNMGGLRMEEEQVIEVLYREA